MNPNPFLGVFLHALGGFAAGSFYIPYKKVRGWAWETYWLVGRILQLDHRALGRGLADLPGLLGSSVRVLRRRSSGPTSSA